MAAMRFWFAMVVLLLALGCTHHKSAKSPRGVDIADPRCYHNGDLTPAQRKQIYPFDKVASVEVVSFKGVYEYDFGVIVGQGQEEVEEPEVIKPDTFERVVLTDAQVDAFTDILFNYNYAKTTTIGIEDVSCYFPRQAVLFKNELGKTFESIEICFECALVHSTLPKRSYGVFCSDKYALLKAFFASLGITYFGD